MNTINSFKGKYHFLSNFEPCVVVLDGIRYGSVEKAFQAAKTDSISERRMIRLCESNGEAKRLGRRVTLRENWDSIKIKCMYDLIKQKFSQDHFRNMLLTTGDAELIEGNHHGDRFWGQVDGEGENWLGKLLMRVREEILDGNY